MVFIMGGTGAMGMVMYCGGSRVEGVIKAKLYNMDGKEKGA